MKMVALVMAGGQGTRFWPESTKKKPKQYLSLTGDESLLTQTLKRFEGLVAAKDRYVVTVKEQEKLAKKASLQSSHEDALIFEPSGRNTAPCILLSIAELLKKGYSEEDVVCIVPSDHVILNAEGFRKTLHIAAEGAAKEGAIVTIGITPNFPHIGFGYLHKGEQLSNDIYKVAEFKEKPNVETATEYLKSGNYLWNAGMFVAQIKTLISEFKKCSPETFSFFEELINSTESGLSDIYAKIPANSIDYAVMEKSESVHVVPAMFDWNDLGSWDALEAVLEKKSGNTIASSDGEYIDEASGNIVFAPGKFVSLIGVNDLIVISNDKNVVVLPKKDSQKVKEIVSYLKENNKRDLL